MSKQGFKRQMTLRANSGTADYRGEPTDERLARFAAVVTFGIAPASSIVEEFKIEFTEDPVQRRYWLSRYREYSGFASSAMAGVR